ncbi:MAG: adenylate/guanylate cyclase domain-containing protein [Candidatus Micrarchaeia archaeon]
MAEANRHIEEYRQLKSELDVCLAQGDSEGAAKVFSLIGALCSADDAVRAMWAEECGPYKRILERNVIWGAVPRIISNFWNNVRKHIAALRAVQLVAAHPLKWVAEAAKRLAKWVFSWTSIPSWVQAKQDVNAYLQVPTEANRRKASSSIKMALFDSAMTAMLAYLAYDLIRDVRADILQDARVMGMTGAVIGRGIVHRIAIAFAAKSGMLAAAGTVAATEREVDLQEHQLTTKMEAYSRYFSPAVIDRISRHDEGHELPFEWRKVTVGFTDIRGFTSLLASRVTPDFMAREILNRQFDIINDIIFQYEGTICDYAGDSAMFMFNAPFRQPAAVDRAVAAAIDIQKALATFNKELYEKHGLTAPIGIGIATGNAIVGNIGSSKFTKYAPVGDAVNMAARLNSLAQAGEIYVDRETFKKSAKVLDAKALGLKLRKRNPLTKFSFSRPVNACVKGKEQPVRAYKVIY